MDDKYIDHLVSLYPDTDIREFYDVFKKQQVKQIIGAFTVKVPKQHVYYHRLAKEFWLITFKKFTKVFLQVRDILKLTQGIPHIIRGSAGCSLICFFMGITQIDPIKYNISLARFMHDDREDFPDIDIDFPHDRRPEIYAKIFDAFPERVARISNHVKYKEKSALKQAIRDHDYHKFIPRDFDLEDIFSDEEDQNSVLQRADELKNTFRCYSLHCGGIIIFDKKVPKDLYLKEFNINDTKTGAQIKLNKDEVEDHALIKIDILSNRGLSQLWSISQMPLIQYPHDTATYEYINQGNNIGITYAESRGMRKIFIDLHPKTIEDIALVLAIIRPAASDQKRDFYTKAQQCDYFMSREDFIIYDDDAIQYIAKLLNIDEGKADIYRKAFAKNKRPEIENFKRQLASEHPDMDQSKILERLSYLQEYSFCKSHAISYAQLVYALAYQKLNNPIQFWLATLNNCHSSYRKWVHFREAKAAGIKLTLGRPPWKLNPTTNKLTGPNAISKVLYRPINDYFEHGYWINDEFLPGMYYTPQNDDKNNTAKFRGIIATYRIYKKPKNRTFKKAQTSETAEVKPRMITFVTIGYEDAKYVDLVLWGGISLSRAHCIEGEGKIQKEGHINVTKWKFSII